MRVCWTRHVQAIEWSISTKPKKAQKCRILEISPHLLYAQDLYPLHIGFDLKSNSTKTMGGLYACHVSSLARKYRLLDCQFPSWQFGQFGSLGLVLPRPIGHIIHLAGERQNLKFTLNIFGPRWQSLSILWILSYSSLSVLSVFKIVEVWISSRDKIFPAFVSIDPDATGSWHWA